MSIKNSGLLLLVVALFLGTTAWAKNERPLRAEYGAEHHATEQDGAFRLDARIMSVDEVLGVMVVAEQEIKLKRHYKKGGWQYQTSFVDSSGHPVAIDLFKPRGKVIVEGVQLPDGALVAERIILEDD